MTWPAFAPVPDAAVSEETRRIRAANRASRQEHPHAMVTTIRRPVIKRCPYKDETDAGELVITFAGEAPELHALAAKVDALCAQPISHEVFTDAIAGLAPGARITTTWSTGPWSVEVTAGEAR